MPSIEVVYNENTIDIKSIQRILEVFINCTPTGKLRNKLCDANIEALSVIIKEEKDSNAD